MRIDMRNKEVKPGRAASVLDQLRAELERRQPANLDAANQIARDFMERANSVPQVDFGGLSPDQTFNLTRPDWIDRSLLLNEQVTLIEVADSADLHNVRELLIGVDKHGTVKATATGAFSRQFATEMFHAFVFDEFIREYTGSKKVINQNDVPHLALYRHMLPVAGLLLYRNGVFSVTRKGKTLLEPARAGALFTLLFRTLLTRMNLGAMDGLPENQHVQATIGYSIARLARMPEVWMEVEEIVSELILPAVAEQLPGGGWLKNPVSSYARLQVLRTLGDLGLVEFDSHTLLSPAKMVRKTPLFHKFIGFSLAGIIGNAREPKVVDSELDIAARSTDRAPAGKQLSRTTRSQQPDSAVGNSGGALEYRHIESKYQHVLLSLETAIVEVDRRSEDLTDLEVIDAVDNVIRTFIARGNGRAEPFARVSPLKRQVQDALKEAAESIMLGGELEHSGDEHSYSDLIEIADTNAVPLNAIVACLKRIRQSIKRWNGSHGRRGYLEYVRSFLG